MGVYMFICGSTPLCEYIRTYVYMIVEVRGQPWVSVLGVSHLIVWEKVSFIETWHSPISISWLASEPQKPIYLCPPGAGITGT